MQQEVTATVNLFPLSLGEIAGHVRRRSRHSPTSIRYTSSFKELHRSMGSASILNFQHTVPRMLDCINDELHGGQ